MTNAWELLLKAKWLADRGDDIRSLYELESKANGIVSPRLNRCGNPITFSLTYLAAKLLEDPDSGLERACSDNLLALIEIRDNAAHYLNKDIYFGRRVLEVGTAALRNYLLLVGEWFQIDLSSYNFFLMPISFYHGFEAAEPASLSHYPEQVQKLLQFIDSLQAAEPQEDGPKQHVALRLETRLVRGRDLSAVAFRWTDDPKAPVLNVREEDVLKNYPLTYRELVDACRRRYADFVENKRFHKLRQSAEKETKYAIVRLLHPANPKSSKQRFYNANILQEFDKHYNRKGKS
jgi:hypothetical protein